MNEALEQELRAKLLAMEGLLTRVEKIEQRLESLAVIERKLRELERALEQRIKQVEYLVNPEPPPSPPPKKEKHLRLVE